MTPRLMTSVALAVAGQQPLQLAVDGCRIRGAHSLGHAIANQQDASPAWGWGNGEIASSKTIGVQAVNFGKPVGLTLDQQAIVDEPSRHHIFQTRVVLGHHLVGDPVEARDLWQWKKNAKKHLLAQHDQHQRQGGKQPGRSAPGGTDPGPALLHRGHGKRFGGLVTGSAFHTRIHFHRLSP